MILPTKRISAHRSLLGLGAEVLRRLGEPKTVSRLWDELKRSPIGGPSHNEVTFDAFVLALDLLFAIGAVTLDRGRVCRADVDTGPGS